MYNWVSQNKIPYAKIGDLLRFKKSDIDKWIAGKTTYPTIDVPLVGVVSCGTPLLAEENIEAKIPVSTKLAKPPHKYFLLRASGDSMDEAGINNGDLVLVRQQMVAGSGDNVVALIDDEATIKELQISNKAIILKPRSTNKEHQPITLTKDLKIQGVVITTI
ncbi:MAG: helix-turn-helix domain-containing protein [Candidatus Omnitrophica bacterium]|nr:helix-turn-helix domain-containing protein [Candidatus Omnitrophota bacterium]